MQRLARELDSRDSKGLAGATLGRVNSPPTEQPDGTGFRARPIPCRALECDLAAFRGTRTRDTCPQRILLKVLNRRVFCPSSSAAGLVPAGELQYSRGGFRPGAIEYGGLSQKD